MSTVRSHCLGLYAVAVLAAAVATPALGATAAPAPRDSREISVLTYNVHGLPWPLSPGRTKKLREIGDELSVLRRERRQPDIVLIQEGFSGGVADLIRASGYRYWARGPQRGDRTTAGAPSGLPARYPRAGEGWGKLTSAGLYILSDYPILYVASQAYTGCAGWDCLANKGVMLARVAVPGLPTPIDVVNTHLNSRHAARVPVSWSIQAYAAQMEQLRGFLDRRRTPAHPLVVGGDFNVKGAPDRYSLFVRAAAPYSTVSEYCLRTASCDIRPKPADPTPWLNSQDLQAFGSEGPVDVFPVETGSLFSGALGPKLSDHDGYLVRYRFNWGRDGGTPPADLQDD